MSADVQAAVLEYFKRPAACYVPEGDVIGEAIAREYGYEPVSCPDRAPAILGHERENILEATDAWIARMVEMSKSDVCMYDACVLAVEYFFQRRIALPQPLAEFGRDIMTDKRRRPTRRGGSTPRNEARDLTIQGAIVLAMQRASQLGYLLHATRNDESVTDSACDVVSTCLKMLNTPANDHLDHRSDHVPKALSYKRIKTIWHNRPKGMWPTE